MFGGAGYGQVGVGELNDLWQYSPTTGQWTWVGGTSTAYSGGAPSGNPGTQGVAAPTNLPSARDSAATWHDKSDNFWLFGGLTTTPSNMSPTGPGLLADLWEYTMQSGEWTYFGGAFTPTVNGSAAGVYGTQGVAAAGNIPTPRAGAATWTDAEGNLWLFGGSFATGGGITGTPFLNDLWKLDPATQLWAWMSGSSNPGSDVSLSSPQGGGTYGSEGTPAAANVPGQRTLSGTWTDGNGNLWLFGGVTPGMNPDVCCTTSNDLWSYDISSGQWTWVSGSMVNGSTPSGTYGTQGAADVDNTPGGRSSPVTFTDGNGNFWLFGGSDWTAARNDVWRFEPANR
jgi:hypothetical protein